MELMKNSPDAAQTQTHESHTTSNHNQQTMINELNPAGQSKIETNPRASQQRAFASLYALYTSYPTWYESFAEANKPDAPKPSPGYVPDFNPSPRPSEQIPIVPSVVEINVHRSYCPSQPVSNMTAAEATNGKLTKNPSFGSPNSVVGHYKKSDNSVHLIPYQEQYIAQVSEKLNEIHKQKPVLTLVVTSGIRTAPEEALADYMTITENGPLSQCFLPENRHGQIYAAICKLDAIASEGKNLDTTTKEGKTKYDQIISKMEDIIKSRDYFSRSHYNGLAVDFRIKGLTRKEIADLKKAVTDVTGCKCIEEGDEKSGDWHLHVTFPPPPKPQLR